MRTKFRHREQAKRSIVVAVGEGATKLQAAAGEGIHRVTLARWLAKDTEFASAFNIAWERGMEERTFRQWLSHPFRGKRPPHGKGTRTTPRFVRK